MSLTMERAFTVELQKPLTLRTLPDTLVQGDREAHVFRVRMVRGGEPVLGAENAVGYLLRPDGQTLVLPGTVESDGSVCVPLAQACYSLPGWVQLCIRVCESGTGALVTVLAVTMQVMGNGGDALLDPCAAVPNLDDLLARLEAMDRASAAANAAITATQDAAAAAHAAAAAANAAVEAVAQAAVVSSVALEAMLAQTYGFEEVEA